MSRLSEREVARRLAERPAGSEVEPPADLLARLKNDIPEQIQIVLPGEPRPGSPLPFRPRTGGWERRQWLMAATVILALGAGLFALRVRQTVQMASEAEEAPAAFPQSPAEIPPDRAAGEPMDRVTDAESTGGIGRPVEQSQDLAAGGRAAKEAPAGRRPASAEPRIGLQEEITVTAESPLLDESQNSTYQSRSNEALPPPPPPPPPPMAARQDALSAEARRRQTKERQEEGRRQYRLESDAEGGVEGGVVGGVSGGVAGGVVGGTPGGVIEVETAEIPLQAAAKPKPPASPAGAPAPSTGGTAEPNDQAYGDVFFRSAGVNPFVDAEEDPVSTFGLDVDTGSWTVVRRFLDDGNLPPAEAVRVEEFVNSFSYGDRPPARGDFALRTEGAPTPFVSGPAADRYRVLRFGLKVREVQARNRKPAVLTFVVDVSGSMEQGDRLGLVKETLGLLLGELRPADRVGLVVYGSTGRVLLEPTADHAAIRRALDRLVAEGSTNAEEGLTLGYQMARSHFKAGAINRIVLCSDGVANVGATGPESILGRIEREARQGIELTTVGFGMGNYNDALMEQLADKGDGRYAYVDSLDEARRVFVEELTGTLQTVARDAKVQVEFNPEVVARYRLLGYENRDIADEDFRNDDVDAGEVGAGHGVSAVYEVKLLPDVRGREVLATLRLRYRSAETDKAVEVDREMLVRDLAPDWNSAPPSLRLAAVVAEFAEILRGSYWARDGKIDDVVRRARELSTVYADTPQGERVAELVYLAMRAARLKDPVERGVE